FERTFPQFEHSHISGRSDVERATVPERVEHTRCIDGRARDHLIERHAEIEELRHHVRKIDDLCRPSLWRPVRGERVGPEAGRVDSHDDVPPQMAGAAIAEIEPAAAAASRQYLWQDVAALIDDAVWRRREHMRDDVTGFEQLHETRQR